MDENTKVKFDEKIKEILNLAKKKKNVLDYSEINDFFLFSICTNFIYNIFEITVDNC